MLGRLMDLIVTVRSEQHHLRFDVEGAWQYNDALNLAYQVKAACARGHVDAVLLDLSRLKAGDGVQGKFLLSDRLQRALPSGFKVALVAPAHMVDIQQRPLAGCATVVVFAAERPALLWLQAMESAMGAERKNPPEMETAGGQMTGKET
jgi:hypothetical protein